MPLTSAANIELNDINFEKMILMTLMISLKEDEPNKAKIGS